MNTNQIAPPRFPVGTEFKLIGGQLEIGPGDTWRVTRNDEFSYRGALSREYNIHDVRDPRISGLIPREELEQLHTDGKIEIINLPHPLQIQTLADKVLETLKEPANAAAAAELLGDYTRKKLEVPRPLQISDILPATPVVPPPTDPAALFQAWLDCREQILLARKHKKALDIARYGSATVDSYRELTENVVDALVREVRTLREKVKELEHVVGLHNPNWNPR